MPPTLPTLFLLTSLFTSSLAAAQEPPASEPEPAAVPAAEPAAADPAPDRVDALIAEVRRIKEEIGLGPVEYKGYGGLGPAASKVYFTPKGLSIGGYGEVFYTFRPAPGARSETDLQRIVLYVGYKFTDRIIFNSEIEFEHAHTLKKGEVAVEFAYLDFKIFDALTLRAGNLLMPMGFINEVHEPPFYFGVNRPEVERSLIPTTWNENGLGLYGEWKGLRYRAYLVNGLQAISEQKCVVDDRNTPATTDDVKLCDTGNTGFSTASWARNARQRGSKAIAETLAGVVSVDYERDLFRVGGSAYFGRSGQGVSVAGEPVKGEVTLLEAHASVTFKGLAARGLISWGGLGDADRISARQGQAIGRQVLGGYLEAGYDVLTLLKPDSGFELSPFVRFEAMDLNHAVATGYTRNPSVNVRSVTAGLHFRPLTTLAVKLDVLHRWPVGGASATQVNLGLGFVF